MNDFAKVYTDMKDKGLITVKSQTLDAKTILINSVKYEAKPAENKN